MKTGMIYLDNAATTPMDPEVLKTMLPYMRNNFGNPSSLHTLGLVAGRALKAAREECARHLKTNPAGIIFTASGSEANNLLLKGNLAAWKGRTVLTSRLEHPSVSEPMKTLAAHGVKIIRLKNDSQGRVDLEAFRQVLAEEPCGLLSLIHGSNEVGTLQDAQTLGRLLKAAHPKAWFHLDGVQSIGHVPLFPREWQVDSLALSMHKIHGPRGVGLLGLYREAKLKPLVAGGGQELGRRSGTENLPAVVGAARALDLALNGIEDLRERMARLRDQLAGGIEKRIPDIHINGAPSEGLPHILSVSFKGLLGEVLLHHLEEKSVYVSTGSACHSQWKEMSETLKALKVPAEQARGTIRLSLSRHTTSTEIDRTLDLLEDRVAFLREVGL